MMHAYIRRELNLYSDPDIRNNVKIWVRLEKPTLNYQVFDGVIPVEDKIKRLPDEVMGGRAVMPADGIEPAARRFQNNMRWLGGLRDCVKWMQQSAFEQNIFYDLVVRLRDDTYAFDRWILDYQIHANALTSAAAGNHGGVNDHNFVVDGNLL